MHYHTDATIGVLLLSSIYYLEGTFSRASTPRNRIFLYCRTATIPRSWSGGDENGRNSFFSSRAEPAYAYAVLFNTPGFLHLG